MEKQVKTLSELKATEVSLRNAIEGGDKSLEIKKAYWRTRAKVEIIESILLWTIVSLMLIIAGCNTIDGMRTDIHQWTDTPSHHQEK